MSAVTDTTASLAANKALYRRWFEEVVSGGDLALADELLADGYGRIAEAWAAYDALGLLQQLGAVPALVG